MKKKIILAFIVLISNFIYGLSNHIEKINDPVIVEITDTSLENIYYAQNDFNEPTKLVFTNLTSVSGSVHFDQNINLVEVDFPMLENTGSYFYFNGNSSLEIINAPNLTTVTDYLYVSGNELLQELNVCNLSEILKSQDSPQEPYYYISNNNSTIDVDPQCFSNGAPENLVISNTSIDENQDINSLIGTLTADSNYTNGSLTYYLTEFELDNESFLIDGNQLVTNTPLDYETKNEYTIKIGVRNQLGEKIEEEFIISIEDIVNEDITIIEITDTSLESIYYYQDNFNEPTKLVFTNLTSVNGSVYFHQNINLVEVDFPMLESTGGTFYFHGNASLEIINAPNLNTVTDYLYVSENESLQELNVCNLSEILQSQDSTEEPYYYISNNNSIVDVDPQCFSNGTPENLVLSNTSINENQDINSLIGTLTADSNYTDGSLTYYLAELEFDNESFLIDGNQLVTNTPLDYETKNEYTIKIGVRNQLGEKIEEEFIISIEDIVSEDITIIEITDTSLESIYYHQDNSFITPTKLIFTNLTSVSGSVYFHQNINLVEVDFPMLENTDGTFYFHGNASLEIINAPNLTTITDYLYVSKNESLQELNICSLSEILQSQDFPEEPYYYIQNNSNLDFSTTCLVKTDISFNPVEDIIIESAPNTLVGTFTTDATTNDVNIRFYFIDDEGNEVESEDFIIIEDRLYLAKEYEEYTETDFTLEINAIRVITVENSNTSRNSNTTNSFNEKVDLTFSLNIENAILNLNTFFNETQEIKIYPNPTKNSFGISSNISIDSVSIFDLTSKHIITYKSGEKSFYIDNLTPGLYLVHLKQKGDLTTYIKKLLIK